ncbi:uncharacterized protein LOC125666555 [Ostrea edulis]|uniref:uncharacterized protein LOC125666555 n=1 Tax=Ostrea edulis TaxID=37623 RepID=UPI0024AEC282|nr:uncharacterized protein LOC125666555 [Ostrea edulis]
MKVDVRFDNFRFDSDILQTHVDTDVLDCAFQCSVNVNCLSIQYRRSVGHCRMFNSVVISLAGSSVEDGWRYYLKVGGKCPDDFTYSGIDGLCFHDGGERTKEAGREYCDTLGSGLVPVTTPGIQAFIEALLEKATPSYSSTKSAYIQGNWNSSHWVDDNGHELGYTKWKDVGYLKPGPKVDSIKIKQFNTGYFWALTSSGRRYVRNVFCGMIID